MANLTTSPFSTFFDSKLKERLYETMAFTDLWMNASEYLNYRTVSIPQYQATASIMKDFVQVGGVNYGFSGNGDSRTSEAALTFNVESFQTKSIITTDFEQQISAWDKRAGSLSNSVNALAEFVGKSILYSSSKNVPSGNTITTTGALTSFGPDGTTARSAVTFSDIVRLGLLFDRDNVVGDRFLVLPANMYASLILDPAILKANELGTGESVAASGVILKLNGINIIKKNTVLQMSGVSASTTVSGSLAVDPFTSLSNQTAGAGIAFVANSIAYASAPAEVYTLVDPDYYGQKTSVQMVAGASASRTDSKGLYILAQK
jgi:hypothetical protein